MGWVAAIFVLVIGLGGLSAGIFLWIRAWRANSFVPVPARVIERTVVGVPGGSGPPRFEPKVKYAYRVEDREFVNDRMAYFQRGHDWKKAHEKLATIPDDITVYVDPRDPSEAVIDRSGQGFAILSCCVGGFLVLISLFIFAMTATQ